MGAVIGGLVTVPALGFMIVPGVQRAGLPEGRPRARSENFTEGKWFVTKFFMKPEAGEVSHRTAYIRNNGLLDGKPSFTIISNRCAHLGCPVQPNGPVQDNQAKEVHGEKGQRITMIPAIPAGGYGCPCHGGQYDVEGNRVSGPPVRALDRYEFSTSSRATSSSVSPSACRTWRARARTPRSHRYKLAGPGQHVDGFEQILYPLQPPH